MKAFEGIQRRIERAIGHSLDHAERADLTAHFPLEAMKQANTEWFVDSSMNTETTNTMH
ncbi:MAG: hypothetical protein GKR87_12525 [Kiritimatiellae bacterium]|nr:hypothetical protein [Kiritimatiellia bacterium]